MNPIALITGASRGIGRGIALELAKTGHNLVINFAGNEAAARQTAADCVAAADEAGHPIRAEVCQADISGAADRVRLVQFTKEKFGRIDLLVNNAGVAPNVRADLLDATEESFDHLIAINAKGPFFLTQIVAREMIAAMQRVAGSLPANRAQESADPSQQSSARIETAAVAEAGSAERRSGGSQRLPTRLPEEVGRGSGRAQTSLGDQGSAGASPCQPKIVTITSVSAYTASVNRGDYCVSKAALSMLTPLFAARLAEHGIGVFEIRPGIIANDMTGPVNEKYDQMIANGLTPIKRWGTPEDIGRAVAAVASGAFPFSTGEVINVDGGFHLRRL
jgi:NAD(P)-dependent dehydrogenase (short-subunit alcohol dehydrogenase family)